MGFLNALGNIMSGKPPFEVQKTGDAGQQDAGAEPVAPGPKQIPRISFGRIENNQQGERLEVFADVRNDSQHFTLLDDVSLNGVRRSIDVSLRPGDVRQVLVYSGPLFRQPPSGYLEVRYRKEQDGDYFIGYYQARCSQGSDRMFKISEFRPNGPVKDI